MNINHFDEAWFIYLAISLFITNEVFLKKVLLGLVTSKYPNVKNGKMQNKFKTRTLISSFH